LRYAEIIRRIAFSIDSWTKTCFRRLRFRFCVFLVKIWFANECERFT